MTARAPPTRFWNRAANTKEENTKQGGGPATRRDTKQVTLDSSRTLESALLKFAAVAPNTQIVKVADLEEAC